jgi:hypothetical protein
VGVSVGGNKITVGVSVGVNVGIGVMVKNGVLVKNGVEVGGIIGVRVGKTGTVGNCAVGDGMNGVGKLKVAVGKKKLCVGVGGTKIGLVAVTGGIRVMIGVRVIGVAVRKPSGKVAEGVARSVGAGRAANSKKPTQ